MCRGPSLRCRFARHDDVPGSLAQAPASKHTPPSLTARPDLRLGCSKWFMGSVFEHLVEFFGVDDSDAQVLGFFPF